jgi:hypothetical protein
LIAALFLRFYAASHQRHQRAFSETQHGHARIALGPAIGQRPGFAAAAWTKNLRALVSLPHQGANYVVRRRQAHFLAQGFKHVGFLRGECRME